MCDTSFVNKLSIPILEQVENAYDPGTAAYFLRFPSKRPHVFADPWEADNPRESDWKFECHELAYIWKDLAL